ncbi:MAG: hypothetical protein JWO42_721, partial [Chloroflexi bacterium]|nr:hypothetical protein [Chloroflexota bacterium]
ATAIVAGGVLTVALTGYVAWRYPGLLRYVVRPADPGLPAQPAVVGQETS